MNGEKKKTVMGERRVEGNRVLCFIVRELLSVLDDTDTESYSGFYCIFEIESL